MAGAFKVAFAIEGDASKAMAAISKLASAIDRLAAVLEKMDATSRKSEKSSQRAGQAASQAGQQARQSWDLATTSANKYMEVFNRINRSQGFTMRTPPTALLPAVAGGGIIPPIPPTVSASAYSFFGAFNAGVGVLKSAGQAVRDFAQKAVAGLTNAVTKAREFASSLRERGGESLKSFSAGLNSMLGGLSRAVAWSQGVFMAATSSFRYITQGLTNIGRSLFFFISIPLGMFFRTAIQGAIDFEDAMVRVGKTTGLWGAALRKLGDELRETAKYTTSSQVELAGIAEVIGQLGVTSGQAISDLTRIFEMLNVTTEMSGEEVANSVGKIANAFKINLNTNTKWVWQAANALNALENETAAAAGEIVDATFRFAQAAAAIGMTAANTMAYGATLVSLGLDAHEAGTALKNMALYAGRNADKIAVAMRNNEKYNTTAKVMKALNEDASQVFIDMANAAAQGGISMEEFVALMDIANMRGGRALVAMANNMDLLNKNIGIANDQWSRQASLLLEYERALSSTKSQMSILRNNLQDVGIIVGDVLFPVLNRVIQILIPAIQMAGEWFKGLDKGAQMLYLGLLAALVLFGPVLFFIQQIVHGLVLVALGFGSLLRLLPLLATGIKLLVALLPGLVVFFTSWPGAVLVAVVAVLGILSAMGVDVSGFFISLANKASEWGSRLMEEYAGGLAQALGIVLKVIAMIARAIASFFRASSPPEKGPLSTIDKWGSALMRMFLGGFLNADFDILNQVGRIIQRILTMGIKDEGMPDALRKVAQARVYLAQLLDIYRKTGKISEDVLSKAVSGLGNLAGDVSKLITLWVKYEDIQRQIKELEERKKAVQKGYSDEIKAIGASNMSLEEKVAAIRQAQFERDEELRAIDKEKDLLEEQRDAAKEQLDFQKNFVEALLDQDDLLARIADAMDKIADRLGSAGDLGAELGEGLEEAFESAKEEMANMGEMWDGIVQRFEEGKRLFEGFLAGFAGEAPDPSMGGYGAGVSEVGGIYTALYNLGKRVRGVYDKILEWKDALLEVWAAVQWFFGGDAGEREGKKFGEGYRKGLLGSLNWKELWADLTKPAGESKFGQGMHGAFDPFINNLLGLDERGIVGWLEDVFEADEGATSLFVDWFVKALTPLDNELKKFFSKLGEGLVNALLEGVLIAFPGIGAVVKINEKIQEWVDGISEYLGVDSGSSTVLLDIGLAVVQGLIDGVVGKVAELYQETTAKVDQWVRIVKELLGISSASTVFFGIGQGVIQGLIDGMNSLIEALLIFMANLINGPSGEGIIGTARSFVGDMFRVGWDLLNGLWGGLKSIWDKYIWPWIQGKIASIPKIFKGELNENSPSKVMMAIGADTLLGYLLGMEKVGRAFNASVGPLAMQSALDGASRFGPNWASAGGGGINIQVNIHDPIVREEEDLKRLADMVSKELSKKLRISSNFGGHSIY